MGACQQEKGPTVDKVVVNAPDYPCEGLPQFLVLHTVYSKFRIPERVVYMWYTPAI